MAKNAWTMTAYKCTVVSKRKSSLEHCELCCTTRKVSKHTTGQIFFASLYFAKCKSLRKYRGKPSRGRGGLWTGLLWQVGEHGRLNSWARDGQIRWPVFLHIHHVTWLYLTGMLTRDFAHLLFLVRRFVSRSSFEWGFEYAEIFITGVGSPFRSRIGLCDYGARKSMVTPIE